jgi:DNA-binding NtrC family response regulator
MSMTNTATVLIADDDTECVTRLAEILQSRQYQVQEAGSGPETLQALNTRDVDLVILDLFIPLLDGIETLKRVRQIDQTLPVLVMSAGPKSEAAAEAVRLGAYDHLTKPIDCERLAIAVRNALMTRCLQMEVLALRQRMSEQGDLGNGNADKLLPERPPAEAQTTTSASGNIDLKSAVSRSRRIIPLREIEKALLRQALKITNYNMSSAASNLGIGRTTLYRKLHKYKIPLPR